MDFVSREISWMGVQPDVPVGEKQNGRNSIGHSPLVGRMARGLIPVRSLYTGVVVCVCVCVRNRFNSCKNDLMLARGNGWVLN